jgi:hypothetical protein
LRSSFSCSNLSLGRGLLADFTNRASTAIPSLMHQQQGGKGIRTFFAPSNLIVFIWVWFYWITHKRYKNW